MTKGSTWQVTDLLSDQQNINNAGQAVTGVVIYFITGDGNEGSVFLANTRFTPKNAEIAVQAQANLLDEVGRLARTE